LSTWLAFERMKKIRIMRGNVKIKLRNGEEITVKNAVLSAELI